MRKNTPILKDSLLYKCLARVVEDIDKFMSDSYFYRFNEITEENQPDFGFVNDLEPDCLALIIEQLIVRKKLNYEYLKVLLPKEARFLTCDENTKFSPFQLDTIRLISKRCPDFEMLHYHNIVTDEDEILDEDEEEMIGTNIILRESILLLENLREINLHDSKIENETMRLITINCSKLIELNLLGTNVTDEGLNYLHDKESIIKNSLTTLIIDETKVSAECVGECLLNLRNLTHFQFDRTIEVCVLLFENDIFKTFALFSTFKTTIFKSKMNTATGEQLVITQDFQQWLIKVFPKVELLILILITENEIPFVYNLLTSWKHISQLELSCQILHEDEDQVFPNMSINEGVFDKLKPTFRTCSKNLISLKLEGFCNIDVFYLGKTFPNLEKLTLINNWILSTYSFSPFKNLKEFDIIYRYNTKHFNTQLYGNDSDDSDDESKPEKLESWDLSMDHWLSLLSSNNIKKLYIYNQHNFTSTLFYDLLSTDCLKNLKDFKVLNCPIKLDCIIQMLDLDTPVEKITIGACPLMKVYDPNLISSYINRNYATNFMMTN